MTALTPSVSVPARAAPATRAYDETSITYLEGLEAVRKRTGMYLGDVQGGGALHQLVWEVVDNAVDEHLAGSCTGIVVTVHADGSVTVEDNGRGIPVGIVPGKGVSAAEVVMTVLHSGSKFGDGAYGVSAGLHGVGVSAVNAVSEWLRVEIRREGRLWLQEYDRGTPRAPLKPIGDSEETGTTVTFKPDPTIFAVLDFRHGVLVDRLRELAFLNRGLRLTLADRRSDGPAETFCFDRGLRAFVEALNEGKEPVHPEVIWFGVTVPADEALPDAAPGGSVELAMQWTLSYAETIRCFANNVANPDGGTHLTGLRAALTKTINTYGVAAGLFKDLKQPLSGEDVREGLTCALSLRFPEARFSSQTKEKLISGEAKGMVETAVAEKLGKYLEEHPATARSIIEKAAVAAKAREAARKARDVIRKSSTDVTSLYGKLSDCQSKDPERSELYIVEGESAGGSAKQGRDRHFQAILPLKGKILNVERAGVDRMLGSAEVGTLITALGCGISEVGGFNIDKLRYHKIILMSDADVDGAHIRTLLLTFFYRQMPQVIEQGHLYIAQPPLYRVRKGKRDLYLKDQAALDDFLAQNAVEGLSLCAAAGGPRLAGQPLWSLARDLRRFRSVIAALGRRFDGRFVAGAIHAARLDDRSETALHHHATDIVADWALCQLAKHCAKGDSVCFP